MADPFNEDLLRRTATRLDPITGNRSAVFSPSAPQVPQGVVLQSYAPMQTSPNVGWDTRPIQPTGPNAATRAMFETRPVVDPAVAQRLPTQSAAAIRPHTPSVRELLSVGQTAPVQPTSPTAGPIAKAARGATTGIGGFVRSVPGAIGRGVGYMAGLDQISTGVNQLLGDQGGSRLEGLGRTALGAATLVPQLRVPAMIGSAGLSVLDAAGGPANIIRNIDAGAARLFGNTPPGQPQADQPTQYWADGRPVAQPVTSQPVTSQPAQTVEAPAVPATPVTQAAAQPLPQTAPRAAPAARPIAQADLSRAGQARLDELRQMAGQQLAEPTQRTIEREPIREMQVFGPANNYGQAQRTGPGMYQLPQWDGPAPNMPEGEVMVDRSGIRSTFSERNGTERLTDMPKLDDVSTQQLVQFINAAQSSSDPRVRAASAQAFEMLRSQAGLESDERIAAGRDAASIRSSQISAAAQGQFTPTQMNVPVGTDALGNPIIKTVPVAMDKRTGQFQGVPTGSQAPSIEDRMKLPGYADAYAKLIAKGYQPGQAHEMLSANGF